jgi:hypothetical protein
LWIKDSELKVRFPRDGDRGTERTVEEVTPQELEQAIAGTVRDAVRIERESAMTGRVCQVVEKFSRVVIPGVLM